MHTGDEMTGGGTEAAAADGTPAGRQAGGPPEKLSGWRAKMAEKLTTDVQQDGSDGPDSP